MKLQPASRKELKRIALGTAVGDVIMIAALFLLSRLGIGTFQPVPILLGAAGGTAAAILNFAILCLTLQNAVTIVDQKQMQAIIRTSYNGRLLLQALWIGAALAISGIHVISAALPLLFPNLTILCMQKGHPSGEVNG